MKHQSSRIHLPSLALGSALVLALAASAPPPSAASGERVELPVGKKVELFSIQGDTRLLTLEAADAQWLHGRDESGPVWLNRDFVVSMRDVAATKGAETGGAIAIRFEVHPDAPDAKRFETRAGHEIWLGPAHTLRLSAIRVSQDMSGFPALGADVAPSDQDWFAEATGAAYENGTRMAVLVDGKVLTAPTINAKLRTGFIVEGGAGGFDLQEVQELIEKVRAAGQ